MAFAYGLQAAANQAQQEQSNMAELRQVYSHILEERANKYTANAQLYANMHSDLETTKRQRMVNEANYRTQKLQEEGAFNRQALQELQATLRKQMDIEQQEREEEYKAGQDVMDIAAQQFKINDPQQLIFYNRLGRAIHTGDVDSIQELHSILRKMGPVPAAVEMALEQELKVRKDAREERASNLAEAQFQAGREDEAYDRFSNEREFRAGREDEAYDRFSNERQFGFEQYKQGYTEQKDKLEYETGRDDEKFQRMGASTQMAAHSQDTLNKYEKQFQEAFAKKLEDPKLKPEERQKIQNTMQLFSQFRGVDLNTPEGEKRAQQLLQALKSQGSLLGPEQAQEYLELLEINARARAIQAHYLGGEIKRLPREMVQSFYENAPEEIQNEANPFLKVLGYPLGVAKRTMDFAHQAIPGAAAQFVGELKGEGKDLDNTLMLALRQKFMDKGLKGEELNQAVNQAFNRAEQEGGGAKLSLIANLANEGVSSVTPFEGLERGLTSNLAGIAAAGAHIFTGEVPQSIQETITGLEPQNIAQRYTRPTEDMIAGFLLDVVVPSGAASNAVRRGATKTAQGWKAIDPESALTPEWSTSKFVGSEVKPSFEPEIPLDRGPIAPPYQPPLALPGPRGPEIPPESMGIREEILPSNFGYDDTGYGITTPYRPPLALPEPSGPEFIPEPPLNIQDISPNPANINYPHLYRGIVTPPPYQPRLALPAPSGPEIMPEYIPPRIMDISPILPKQVSSGYEAPIGPMPLPPDYSQPIGPMPTEAQALSGAYSTLLGDDFQIPELSPRVPIESAPQVPRPQPMQAQLPAASSKPEAMTGALNLAHEGDFNPATLQGPVGPRPMSVDAFLSANGIEIKNPVTRQAIVEAGHIPPQVKAQTVEEASVQLQENPAVIAKSQEIITAEGVPLTPEETSAEIISEIIKDNEEVSPAIIQEVVKELPQTINEAPSLEAGINEAKKRLAHQKFVEAQKAKKVNLEAKESEIEKVIERSKYTQLNANEFKVQLGNVSEVVKAKTIEEAKARVRELYNEKSKATDVIQPTLYEAEISTKRKAQIIDAQAKGKAEYDKFQNMLASSPHEIKKVGQGYQLTIDIPGVGFRTVQGKTEKAALTNLKNLYYELLRSGEVK